jgi:oligopeptide transport system ATP-binding protein
LDLHRGETIAIVGESGSGKSVTTKAVMGILAGNGTINKGSIEFTYPEFSPERIKEIQDKYDGKIPEGYVKPEEVKTVDIVQCSPKFIQSEIRGRRIAMVFQDPMTSLDPTMNIGKQVMEAMRFHYKTPKKEAYEKAVRLLELVGITDARKRMKNYPHQLSGGMRQRVVIAIALSCDPDILICDEPTTALDVTIQAKILELIQEIQKKKDLSVIYITHDLGVVAKVADFVNVMYAGRIIESGTVNDIFYDPKHPYTWGLLASMPDIDASGDELYTIPGTPPNLLFDIQGDAFAPRNRYALHIDEKVAPPMFKISPTHHVASWLAAPQAPKVEMPADLKRRVERMRKEAGLE